MEHCPLPTVHTSHFPSHYTSSSASHYSSHFQHNPLVTDSTPLVLKSEDPTLDEELLNLKLERLRLLEQIRELEIENSSLTPFQEGAPTETPTESTSSEEETSPTSSVLTHLTDEEFARKILNEDLAALKQTGKTQDQIRQAITQQVETLLEQDPNFAQNLSNFEKDEQLARKLEQQYLKTVNYQIEEDEKMARKLDLEENRVNSYYYSPTSPTIGKKPALTTKPLRTPSGKYSPMNNRTSTETRKHAVEIHNRNCACKKTTPGYNGHIYKIHDQFCSCCKLHS